MEPFGLLNLLKTLLPQTENQAHTDEEPNENASLQKQRNDTAQSAENDTHTPARNPDNGKNDPENFAPQNAFLDFINRHEERKKNVKKT